MISVQKIKVLICRIYCISLEKNHIFEKLPTDKLLQTVCQANKAVAGIKKDTSAGLKGTLPY